MQLVGVQAPIALNGFQFFCGVIDGVDMNDLRSAPDILRPMSIYERFAGENEPIMNSNHPIQFI